MDKYEYKVCLEDIKSLIAQNQYAEAVKIADTIDWRRVKSVRTLCMISDLYKINHRPSESRDVLYMAYQRDGENPQIIYSMCLLELSLDEYLRALQLYNEFIRVAPRDPGRFILQYKLYQAQNVSLDEQTAVLEELKKRVFKDKWVYELATLYDRRGLYARCAELCDELIAGGKPKYVREALELKRTHSPLTPEQEAEYNRIMAVKAKAPMRKAPAVVKRSLSQEAAETAELSGMEYARRKPAPGTAEEIHIRPMDEGMASTVNLQAAVAEGLREIMKKDAPEEKTPVSSPVSGQQEAAAENAEGSARNSVEESNPSDPERSEFREVQEKARAVRERMNDEEGNPARRILQQRREEQAARQQRPQPQKPDFDAQMAQETDGQYSMRIDEHGAMPAPHLPVMPHVEVQGTLARRGVKSWEEIRRRTDEKNAAINRQRVRDTTGPILADFDEKASRSVVDEIEEQNADDARMRRYRSSMPQGGLSDGMTDNERVNVARARADNTGAADNLVRDEDAGAWSSTRVWQRDAAQDTAQPADEERASYPETEEEKNRPYPETEEEENSRYEAEPEYGEIAPEEELPEADSAAGREAPAEEESGSQAEVLNAGTGTSDSEETASAETASGETERQTDGEKGRAQDAETAAEPDGQKEASHWNGNAVQLAQSAEEKEREEKLSATQEIAELIRREFAKDREEEERKAQPETVQEDLRQEADAQPETAQQEQPETAQEDLRQEPETAQDDLRQEADAQPETTPGEISGRESAGAADAAGYREEKSQPASGQIGAAAEREKLRGSASLRRREHARRVAKETASIAAVRETGPMEENDFPAEELHRPVVKAGAAEEMFSAAEETALKRNAAEKAASAEPNYAEADDRAAMGGEQTPSARDAEGAAPDEEAPAQEAGAPGLTEKAFAPAEERHAAGMAPAPAEERDAAGNASASTSAPGIQNAAGAAQNMTETDRRDAARIRSMTREQKKLFGAYLRERNTRTKLLDALDNVSLASYTGNIAIAGVEEGESNNLARAILKNAKQTDSNFSGKAAVVSGAVLNHKDPEELISRVDNGGLIVERASTMSVETCERLHKALEREDRGVIVILVDSRHGMDRLFRTAPALKQNFTSRVDIIPLSDDELVHLGVRYAARCGCSMDEMAKLALHSRVASMQKINHHVTAQEVQTIVDEAIGIATRKTPAHLMDSMFGKRRDDDGRIILREKDFAVS